MIPKNEFVSTIAPIIVREGKARGYHIFSPVIAQAVIESAYGQSGLSANYNNFFGLKCGGSWKGKSVNLKTKEEYTIGNVTTIRDNFRVYDSVEAGVKGYYDFISMTRYANLRTATTPLQYCQYLKADGYATSSTYVNTLMNTINNLGLTKYDQEGYNDNVQVATSSTSKKSNDTIAQEVIDGMWGNGEDRKARLESAGYNYSVIQNLVNLKVANKKSNATIAREVIQGKWGNGAERKQRLQNAGYNPATIQSLVNDMLRRK